MKAMKWINTGAFAAMIGVNALANLLPIGGSTTGQISEAYPNLFTPAPITFAIWGVIYLLTALFVVYQWGVFDHGRHSAMIRENVGPWFALSCMLNIGWILLWHFRMTGLAMFCILILLAVLWEVRDAVSEAEGNLFQRMSAKAGISLYFGWIVAASLANLSVLLVKSGWNGWGLPEDFWTVAALFAGAVIAAAMVLIGNDRIAAAAVMWAYAGILIRHIAPVYYAAAHPVVIVAAFVSEAVILAAMLMPWIERIFSRRKYVSQH